MSKQDTLDAYALTLLRWGTIAGINPEHYPELWAHVQRTALVPAVAALPLFLLLALPLAFAMPRELQWVAFSGQLSNVLTITASMRTSSIMRGAPERGSSCSPVTRCSIKRRRHLPTVCRSSPSLAATSVF